MFPTHTIIYITIIHITIPTIIYTFITKPHYNIYSKQTYIKYGIYTWACLILTTIISHHFFHGIQTALSSYNLLHETLRLLILSILFDFWFYLIHRLSHEIPYIYKNFHKFHHKATQPTPFDGLMVDPIEGFFLTNLPAAFMIHTLNFHIITYYLIIPLAHILVFINHSPLDKRHLKHHETSMHNFGAFWFSDWIMGTNYDNSLHKK